MRNRKTPSFDEDIPDEDFGGPGFRLRRYGRFNLVEVNRTDEEQQDIINHLIESGPRIADEIREISQDLEQILNQYDPIDLVAHIMVESIAFIENGLEQIYSPKILAFFPEHLALLALKHPYSSRDYLVDYQVLENIVEKFRRLHALLLHFNMYCEAKQENSKPEDFQHFCFSTKLNEINVRGRTTNWHIEEVLQEMFSPFESKITQSLGYNVHDALAISKAISQLFFDKMAKRKNESHVEARKLRQILESYKKTNQLTPGCGESGLELIESLAKLSETELNNALNNIAFHRTFHGVGEVSLVSADEISKETGIDISRTTAYLSHHSLEFGCIDADYFMPQATHELRAKPFIHVNGRYFVPSPWLVEPAIQLGFEEYLKRDPAMWHRYEDHRHDVVLAKSISLMRDLMPNSGIYTHLKYDLLDCERNEKGELDGLIKYGSVLFLIEVKAASFTDPARRGAPERLERDLKNLLVKAHSQAARARDRILVSDIATFRSGNGKDLIEVQREQITSIFLICLTLEPIGFVTSMINAETKLGLFNFSDTEFPWMVNLYDLMVISEIIKEPFIFPHYIKWRTRLASQGGIQSGDELDFFGAYLHGGLVDMPTFEDGDPTSFYLDSHTHQIDRYLYGKHGYAKPTKRPIKNLPSEIRILFQKLASLRGIFDAEVALAILDMSIECQRELVKRIETSKKKSKSNEEDFVVSSVFDESPRGFTYIASTSNLFRKLQTVCLRNKQKHHAKAWYGLGLNTRSRAYCTILV